MPPPNRPGVVQPPPQDMVEFLRHRNIPNIARDERRIVIDNHAIFNPPAEPQVHEEAINVNQDKIENLDLETQRIQFNGSYAIAKAKKHNEENIVYVQSIDPIGETTFSYLVRPLQGERMLDGISLLSSEWSLLKFSPKTGLYNINGRCVYLFKHAHRQFVRGFHKHSYGFSFPFSVFFPVNGSALFLPDREENPAIIELCDHSLPWPLVAKGVYEQKPRPAVKTAINRIRESDNRIQRMIAVHLHYGICLSPNPKYEFVVFKDTIPIAFLTENPQTKKIATYPHPSYQQETLDFVKLRLGEQA